jgi:hypothetical protein
MFRKMCALCVGLALCLSMLGCGGNKVEMPKEKAASPAPKVADKPGAKAEEMAVPQ